MKSYGGSVRVALSMKVRQILAGYVAPNTLIPPTFVIGVNPLGSPIHTAAVYCGVNPTNQASALSSVVPVFPAAGRGKLPSVFDAVPLRIGPFNISTSVRATFGSRTRAPTLGAW